MNRGEEIKANEGAHRNTLQNLRFALTSFQFDFI